MSQGPKKRQEESQDPSGGPEEYNFAPQHQELRHFLLSAPLQMILSSLPISALNFPFYFCSDHFLTSLSRNIPISREGKSDWTSSHHRSCSGRAESLWHASSEAAGNTPGSHTPPTLSAGARRGTWGLVRTSSPESQAPERSAHGQLSSEAAGNCWKPVG